MKKVLFLIEDLKFGGAEVSLVNLLNSLDLGGYTNDRCTGHSAIFWHYKMLQGL